MKFKAASHNAWHASCLHNISSYPGHVLKLSTRSIGRCFSAALEPKPKLYGYRSVKEAPGEDGKAPIYIYPIAGERARSENNLLGWCLRRQTTIYEQTFDHCAHLIEDAKPDGLLVMDQIGPNDNRFLAAVRDHKNAKCFTLTGGNVDVLFPVVLSFLHEQITGRQSIKMERRR